MERLPDRFANTPVEAEATAPVRKLAPPAPETKQALKVGSSAGLMGAGGNGANGGIGSNALGAMGVARGAGGVGDLSVGLRGAGLGAPVTGAGTLGGKQDLGGIGLGRGAGGSVVGNKGMSLGAADPSVHDDDAASPALNGWTAAAEDHLSTFAVDVDTASYTLARRALREGRTPDPRSVRVEEFVNYFKWADAPPTGDAPFAVHLEAAASPFTPGNHLLRVALKTRALALHERKPLHLTFLVDVSGSMQGPDRLPLAKRALRMLVDNLHDGDTVALVTYAGGVRLVLPPTGLEHKGALHEAIEALSAGGSTAMASGIALAYAQAQKTLDGVGESRVVILSDGDANVGPTSHQEILSLIEGHVKEGITVTTLGFGAGNYRDTRMEQLADKGNGNHHYVDSLMAARRILVEQMGSTLEVVAKDVKLQVDFDPRQVLAYRLVGYENRDVADRDFRNDRVDAGELGSGHQVTALYEVKLKPEAGAALATVRLRAKSPKSSVAQEWSFPFAASALRARFADASSDFRFATAVVAAAERLRESAQASTWSWPQIAQIARGATAAGDAEREEFLALIEGARKQLASR